MFCDIKSWLLCNADVGNTSCLWGPCGVNILWIWLNVGDLWDHFKSDMQFDKLLPPLLTVRHLY